MEPPAAVSLSPSLLEQTRKREALDAKLKQVWNTDNSSLWPAQVPTTTGDASMPQAPPAHTLPTNRKQNQKLLNCYRCGKEDIYPPSTEKALCSKCSWDVVLGESNRDLAPRQTKAAKQLDFVE
jgi:hypothetical protein